MSFDSKKLRKDLEEECMGAFFAGGFGGAMAEKAEIEKASSAELRRIANRMGIDPDDYDDDEDYDEDDEDDDQDE